MSEGTYVTVGLWITRNMALKIGCEKGALF